jgi:hypothetical protein
MFLLLLSIIEILNYYGWRGMLMAGALQQIRSTGERQPANCPLRPTTPNKKSEGDGDPQTEALEEVRQFPEETASEMPA